MAGSGAERASCARAAAGVGRFNISARARAPSTPRRLASLFLAPPPAQSLDKLTKVGGQLKTLQATMAKNLVLADERHTLLEREVDKTADLAASARGLFARTGQMRRIVCCRYWMTVAIIVGIAVGIIVAAVLIINYTKTHWWA